MVADAHSTPTPRPFCRLRGTTPLYLPRDWEPVHAALAWIAFGTALPLSEWDEHLYIGASERMTRADVLQCLERMGAEPGSLDGFLAGAPETGLSPDEVPPSIRESVEALASRLGTRQARRGGASAPDRLIRCAAKLLKRRYSRTFAADPRWAGYVDAELEALAEAERELLRWAADGSIPLYGWPDSISVSPQTWSQPRTRIPKVLCEAPVSFHKYGLLLPCLPYDTKEMVPPLFWNVVVPANSLLASSPRLDQIEGQTVARPVKKPTGAIMGRPPTHDWLPFRRKLVEIVANDAGFLDRGELLERMRQWAEDNMASKPDARTVEREVAALAPRGGVIPG